MKLKVLFTTVLLMAICSVCSAEEAYAEYNNGTLTFYYDNTRSSKSGTTYDLNTGSDTPGWITAGKKFKRVEFVSSFADYRPTSTYDWFFQQSELTTFIGLNYLKTDNVKNMGYMFYQCSGLTSLNLSDWNTGNVISMSGMFQGCSGLTSLNLSDWNTSNVTIMSWMFQGCSGLTNLNLSGWNTGNVMYMDNMFNECSSLTSLNMSGWNTSNVKRTNYMFYKCKNLTSLNLSNFNTTNVTNMKNMFSSCSGLKSLNLSSFNTVNVNDMSYMFSDCSGLTNLDVSSFNTANVNDMSYMFYNCSGLTSLDLGGFNTENVTSMSLMFYGCSSLTSLDLSCFNTGNVTKMGSMFSDCNNLITIYVGDGWNADKLGHTNMFSNCTSLVGGEGTVYDANHIDTEYAHIDDAPNNPGYMSTNKPAEVYVVNDNGTLTFYYNSHSAVHPGTKYALNTGSYDPDWYDDRASITKVVFDPSFQDARPSTTYSWFHGMSNLTEITNIQYLNTSQVTTMRQMFRGCSSLTSLNLSSFNTANVTSMYAMFFECSGITSLDLSSFNTENLTEMNFMFSKCSSLTSLDLSSFNTSNVTSMGSIFLDCSNLKTIYAGDGWNTDNVRNTAMFSNCTSLVGGEGTTFNSSHVNKEYARIDGGPTSATPGYLTIKVYDLKIAGTDVTSMNKSDVLDDGGTVKFDGNKTLTLNNADISINVTNGYGIYNKIDDLVVVAKGTNTVNSYQHTACYTNTVITFVGDGTLTLNGATGGLSSSSTKITVRDGVHLICLGNQWSGIDGHRNFSNKCITTLEMSGASTILEAESPNGSMTDIKALSLNDGLGIYSPTGAVFSNNAVRDASGNFITSRVIIKYSLGIATEISDALPQDNVQCSMFNVQSDEWYTIDGQKLNGMPTKKGVYIHNGRAVVH